MTPALKRAAVALACFAAALTEVLWRYGQSHTADGELTWDARLSADASADYERDGG